MRPFRRHRSFFSGSQWAQLTGSSDADSVSNSTCEPGLTEGRGHPNPATPNPACEETRTCRRRCAGAVHRMAPAPPGAAHPGLSGCRSIPGLRAGRRRTNDPGERSGSTADCGCQGDCRDSGAPSARLRAPTHRTLDAAGSPPGLGSCLVAGIRRKDRTTASAV